MTIAAQAMLRTIRRRVARSVVIKDAKAYEALYGQLQSAMSNAWSDAMREGIAASLDRLRDLGPGAFTKDDGAMILRVLEASVGADAIRTAMRDPVVNLSDALFRVGAEEVGTAAGVSIAFARPDLDALDILKTGNLYWVGNSWNVHSQNLLAKTLEDYFTEGMTREGLAARMAEDFAGVTERGQVYWEILADHTATKTREMGRVSGYDRAGIDRIQVRAHLDDRTTRICRHMHGRVIEVSRLREQRDTYLDAVSRRNEPAAKAAWTMHGETTDFSNTPTSQLDRGTGGPPYHFRCRTITVAYFGAGDELAALEQNITDREPLSASQVAYVEDRVAGAAWMHAKNARAHWTKHGSKLQARRLADYEGSARAVITSSDARMRVSMRVPADAPASDREPKPYAIFAVPQVYRPSGGARKPALDGQLMTAVRLDTNEIVTHHWRDDDLTSANDVVPARDVRKSLIRRIMEWITG